MKDTRESDAASRPQTLLNGVDDDGDEANSLPDSHIELEDEDLKAPETETDLSIFAPVESSESEKDELSDSPGVSSWRRTNARERVSVTDNRDVAPPEKKSSSRSFKGRRKRRQKQNPECSAADRGMNKGQPPEKHTFHQALPRSDLTGHPVQMSGLHTAISPCAAMEPPVFPNTPVMSKSVVGEDQQNLLLEVLNHCRFLHAAVERLEQKIDRQMSCEAKLPFEEEQLSWSLAQRLGPPVQRNPQWIPPWKRNTAQHGLNRADLHMDNSGLESTKPPGGGRGKDRRRGRGRRGRNNNGSKRQSQTPDLAPHMPEALRDGILIAETDNPQPTKVGKKSFQLHTGPKGKQNKKKGLAQVDRDPSNPVDSEKTFREDIKLGVKADRKVMIGSPLRKVWIPLSVYKKAFKETEPQKALVPVLYSLFSGSTLSCGAVTGNPAKGIKQLDSNKIEALREFLAEMYPQYDVSLRGVTWALCVGVIDNITKHLKKKGKKHVTEKVDDSGNDAAM